MQAKPDFSGLKALFINCTLKRSPRSSHTKGLMDVSMEIMRKVGAEVDYIRAVDHQIAFGVMPDMTEEGYEEDAWPQLFEKVKEADILVIGSPIWLGQASSITSLVIERLYAMSAKLNERGQSIFYNKVGGCLITGNEDGIKHVSMQVLYSLQHLGYSIPPQADAGWIGEVGPGPSYLDDKSGGFENSFTQKNTTFMTYNLLHLAQILKSSGGYSNYGNDREAWKQGNHFEHPDPATVVSDKE